MNNFEELMILWDIQESINSKAIKITNKNRHLIKKIKINTGV